MKRKTFVKDWGVFGFGAMFSSLSLLGLQVHSEVVGDESVSSWIVVIVTLVMVMTLAVVCALQVRRHNAKVDKELRRQRENWTRANGAAAPEHWGR